MFVTYDYRIPIGPHSAGLDVNVELYVTPLGDDIRIHEVRFSEMYAYGEPWTHCHLFPALGPAVIDFLVNNIVTSAYADAEWCAVAWEKARA